jgi:hypothetical protein
VLFAEIPEPAEDVWVTAYLRELADFRMEGVEIAQETIQCRTVGHHGAGLQGGGHSLQALGEYLIQIWAWRLAHSFSGKQGNDGTLF